MAKFNDYLDGANLLDDDLILISRQGKTYKLTGLELLGEVRARLDALEAGGGGVATIYNTLAGSSLPGSAVQGFLDPANDLDTRLAALGA